MSNYVVGDIHGMYDMLIDNLERIGFDKSRDTLYCVGDLCDRGEDNLRVVEYLYNLGSSFKCVFGNHDIWLYDFLKNGNINDTWEFSGGYATINEFAKLSDKETEKYCSWLGDFHYMLNVDNNIICHNFIDENILENRLGGDDRFSIILSDAISFGFIEDIEYDEDLWDRKIADYVISKTSNVDTPTIFSDKKFNKQFKKEYNYIMGHTPIIGGIKKYKNLTIVDTGAFIKNFRHSPDIKGFLTIMCL